MTKNKTLVTGASGFIGSSLVNMLAECSEVVGTSRTPRGDHLVKAPDLNDISTWSSLLADVSVVVHCAGRAHVLSDDPVAAENKFEHANIKYTEELAKLAIKNKVKRFIFFSSIGVYGTVEDGVVIDEDTALRPEELYAKSKYEAECILKRMFLDSELDLIIIRPPLVYSSNAPGNFKRLIKLSKSPIPNVFVSVKNKRTMLSLTNLLDFIKCIVFYKSSVSGEFVVCDDESVSTSNMINYIRKGAGVNYGKFYIPKSIIKTLFFLIGKKKLYIKMLGDLEVSNSKVKKAFGWKPIESAERALLSVGSEV